MGGEFQFFDIIILAFIAGYLVLRLRRVLGRRDGHEGGFQDQFRDREDPESDTKADDNVVHLPDRAEDVDVTDIDDSTNDPISAGIIQVRVADPTFDPAGFAEGAKMAFEMILNAFASGDRKSLKDLLSPDVYKNFDNAISEREVAGEKLEDTLVGIRSSEIIEASMDSHHSVITLKFVSEQISALRDTEDNIIDGNPNEVIEVTDFWTFSRDTRSKDPNWTLIGTDSNN